MGPIYSFDEFIDMTRRRAPMLLAVIVLGCIVSVFFALRQQHMYRSSEVIQIARPKIADELAPSTVQGSSARRLQLIQQQLMARGTILDIVRAYDLYADRPDLKPSELVELVRNSVSIDGVAAAREGFSDDGTMAVLTISAEMPTPEQAQQVAQEFAHRTIKLSVSTRIDQARDTLAFFNDQQEKLAVEIATLESRIADFRNTHDLSLPGSVELRRSEIGSINTALLEIDRERIATQRRADEVSGTVRVLAGFEVELETLDAQRKLLLERRAELAASLETTPEIERELNALQRDLDQLQDQLELISTRRAEAEVGFRLESQRQAERLTVIEPASLPDYPVTRSRKKVAAMGGLVSVAVAFVIAYLLELRNPVIRTAEQMERETGLRPVVSIPFLATEREHMSAPTKGQAGPASDVLPPGRDNFGSITRT